MLKRTSLVNGKYYLLQVKDDSGRLTSPDLWLKVQYLNGSLVDELGADYNDYLYMTPDLICDECHLVLEEDANKQIPACKTNKRGVYLTSNPNNILCKDCLRIHEFLNE